MYVIGQTFPQTKLRVGMDSRGVLWWKAYRITVRVMRYKENGDWSSWSRTTSWLPTKRLAREAALHTVVAKNLGPELKVRVALCK